MRLAYLGPAGSFTEAALLTLDEARDAELDPRLTITDALDAVRTGVAAAALVPLENSVEGSVNRTLDELGFGPDQLAIRREVLLPITIALLARPGTELADISTVLSMPHAAAQCRRWLAANLAGAEVVETTSTSDAARQVAGGSTPSAALGAPGAAEQYGLAVLAPDVGDNPDAVTRFVLVGLSDAPPPPPTGADRTSVVEFIAEDHPGALLELLEQFAARGVNLSRIESRPTGAGMGRYCFFVDCEGHVAEARVGEALTGLRRTCAGVRFLGSYPRADALPSTPARGCTDDDFATAGEWLAAIREGRS